MTQTVSISLGKHFTGFLNQLTENGRYGSAREAIQAALRLLEQEESQIQMLQNALTQGEESRESTKAFSDIVKMAKTEFHAL
jgi:antitoxin ParD1/3/4